MLPPSTTRSDGFSMRESLISLIPRVADGGKTRLDLTHNVHVLFSPNKASTLVQAAPPPHRSPRNQTAVHQDFRPGRERGGLGQEPHHRVGHLAGLAEAANGDLRLQLSARLVLVRSG